MRVLKLAFSLILLPSLVLADCGIGDALLTLRPRAEWNLRGETYEGLEWLDRSQTKPTSKEVSDAMTACEQQRTSDDSARAQAKFDLNSTAKTDTERLNALITYMGLNK